jgi:hypothetical protein
MGLMIMAASASNQIETESEFLSHDSWVKVKRLAVSVEGRAHVAWLKVLCRMRDSKRRIQGLLYLMDFCSCIIIFLYNSVCGMTTSGTKTTTSVVDTTLQFSPGCVIWIFSVQLECSCLEWAQVTCQSGCKLELHVKTAAWPQTYMYIIDVFKIINIKKYY